MCSIPNTSFGVAAIKAALDNVHILFVGPEGVQGKLERTALRMSRDDGDLRLRAEVVYNFLKLKEVLHGGVAAPTIDEVNAMVHECNAATHINANGPNIRRDMDSSLERATEPSDVAGGRTTAQSDTQRAAAGDTEMSDGSNDMLLPNLNYAGVLDLAGQQMQAAIAGIKQTVKGVAADDAQAVDGGTGGTPPTANGAAAGADGTPTTACGAAGHAFMQQRASTPYNDYDSAVEALYAAWWPLLPLRQGLRRGKAILDSKWRHMFCCEPCADI